MISRSLLLTLLVLTACGTPDCKLTDPKTCSGSQVCEPIQGKDKALCFQPVLIEGTVKVLGSSMPIANAEVVALEAGVPATVVGKTGSDGAFSLRVPTTRSDEMGTVVGRVVTLAVAAQDFAPFPQTIRRAITTIDTGKATSTQGKPTIANTGTDISLVSLSPGEKGRPSVSGTVELSAGQVPIVAVEGNGHGYTGFPDSTGAFKIFNVAPGNGYRVQAYAKGANFTAVDENVTSGTDITGATIKKGTTADGGTMSGTLTFGAGANASGTSVVMALESTYSDSTGRGELVPGLRAADVTTTYSITGIPDGKYVVLIAYENDGNFRDPDVTATVPHVVVASGNVSAMPVLKAVGAIEVRSPGAGDALDEVSTTPTFTWKAFPGATSYVLGIFTNQGVKTYDQLGIFQVPNADGNIVVNYPGSPVLTPGVIYQWRVAALGVLLNPLSATEDYRGQFTVK